MVDRAYPHSIDSERALLGGLIRDPRQLDEIAGIVDPEDFYRPDHGAMLTLLLDMRSQGHAIDMVTVPERIGREGREDRYGGVAYVAELPDHVPSTANLEHYAVVIKDKALLRRFITSSEEMVEEARAEPEDVSDLLERATQEMFTLGQGKSTRTWHQVSLTVDDETTRIQKLSEHPGEVTGVTTGFTDLDRKLAGLHPTDLVILAARPSMGKTALALNIAQNAAALGGVAVGLFSLEMSRGQLVTRMLCCDAMVDASRVRTGRLTTEDWEIFLEASDRLRLLPVFIDDTPGVTINQVRARARRLKMERPDLGLIVVDYIQLMQGDPRISREQQVSGFSRGMKALAKELEVPVLALSQLNRGVESRQDKRPLLSDLRESGAIEQDADVILFIYRDEFYNQNSTEQGIAEVIISKQRQGPIGTVKLVFQGKYTRFDNYLDDDFGR